MREVHHWEIEVIVGNGLTDQKEVVQGIHEVTRTALAGGQILSILSDWDSGKGSPVVTVKGIGLESLAYITQALGVAPDAQEETLTEAT